MLCILIRANVIIVGHGRVQWALLSGALHSCPNLDDVRIPTPSSRELYLGVCGGKLESAFRFQVLTEIAKQCAGSPFNLCVTNNEIFVSELFCLWC